MKRFLACVLVILSCSAFSGDKETKEKGKPADQNVDNGNGNDKNINVPKDMKDMSSKLIEKWDILLGKWQCEKDSYVTHIFTRDTYVIQHLLKPSSTTYKYEVRPRGKKDSGDNWLWITLLDEKGVEKGIVRICVDGKDGVGQSLNRNKISIYPEKANGEIDSVSYKNNPFVRK